MKNNEDKHLQAPLQPPANHGNKENKTRNILFMTGLIVLIIAVVGYFVVKNNPGIFSSGGSDDSNNFASYVPIFWVAVFIPLMAMKKKKQQQKKQESLIDKKELDKEQQRIAKLVIIGLIVVATLGVLFFASK